MLLLSERDIRQVFSMADAIEANKACYRQFSQGRYQVPLRTVLSGESADYLFMPAYSREKRAAGLKLVSVVPGNPARGLPALVGQVLLLDGETGQVTALLDGTCVTALRTGAASGAAFDLFGLPDAKTGALIGTGSQALCQLEAMVTARPLTQIRIAGRSFEKTKAFAERAKALLPALRDTELLACRDGDTAVEGAELVALATPSPTPVCRAESFRPGCTISAVGAYTYEMQELPPEVFLSCGKLYFDSEEAVLSESGDILRPLETGLLRRDQFTGEIGQLLLGEIPGRESDREIIVFENVGFGALDLNAALEIYERAAARNAGLRWEP